MGLQQIQPHQGLGKDQIGLDLDLDLPAAKAGVPEVAHQHRADVVDGHPVERDIVGGITVELAYGAGVSDDRAVHLLDALRDAGAARRELQERQVVGSAVMDAAGRRTVLELLDREDGRPSIGSSRVSPAIGSTRWRLVRTGGWPSSSHALNSLSTTPLRSA